MAAELQSSESKEDPIAYYIEDQQFHGKSTRTLDAYERVLRQFEAYVIESNGFSSDNFSIKEDIGRRECMEWVHSLRADQQPSTVATYASYVHRFFDYMNEIGTFETNPMTLVMAEMPESIETNPTRRDITIEQMRSFVGAIHHPLDRAIIVLLLKTGIRVGELCNLDIQDININATSLSLPNKSRVELEGRPMSLYVDSTPSLGQSYNGEVRTASNKRKRSTIVPIDAELAVCLQQWLAIRPDAISNSEPLFLHSGDSWGERLHPNDVRYIVMKYAKGQGWYRTGGGAAENVTPHYFRHFFTTHLRDRTGDRGIVKYLRGDVATDIIDTYTHNWGDRVKTVYERNIYTLL